MNGKIEFGEVQFYFIDNPNPKTAEERQTQMTYAVLSVYSPPNKNLLEELFHTLHACSYRGQEHLICIPYSSIITVVSMQPLPWLAGDPENLWFVVEKGGLDDVQLFGYEALNL